VRPRPRRGQPAPRRKRKRRLGTLLFLVGVLAVLGGTFAVGALAGRFSLRPTASVASAKTPERPARPVPSPQPELTFYRELTAPLTPPPLPPKPAARPGSRRETPPVDVVTGERAGTDAAPAIAERKTPEGAVTATAGGQGTDAARYTVQVGSYNARAQADALRERLASAGHDAYVAEGESGGVTRYRVRVGTFSTAEDARQAAVRLASEARVATYVTTR
jgi:cell division protein FtsN